MKRSRAPRPPRRGLTMRPRDRRPHVRGRWPLPDGLLGLAAGLLGRPHGPKLLPGRVCRRPGRGPRLCRRGPRFCRRGPRLCGRGRRLPCRVLRTSGPGYRRSGLSHRWSGPNSQDPRRGRRCERYRPPFIHHATHCQALPGLPSLSRHGRRRVGPDSDRPQCRSRTANARERDRRPMSETIRDRSREALVTFMLNDDGDSVVSSTEPPVGVLARCPITTSPNARRKASPNTGSRRAKRCPIERVLAVRKRSVVAFDRSAS